MDGYIQVFDDDSTGFAPYQSAATDSDGYLRVLRSGDTEIRLYPAVGDIDGDGRAEVLVGTEAGSEEGLVILDDAVSGFVAHPAIESGGRSIRPVPTIASGPAAAVSRHVATGDVDGDGVDEIVVSFGRDGAGEIRVLDDARGGFREDGGPALAVLMAGRADYVAADGSTRVALGDIDDDGRDELVVGFGEDGERELQVFDDALAGSGPLLGADGFVTTRRSKRPLYPAPIH
jgi:hypothetical protein